MYYIMQNAILWWKQEETGRGGGRKAFPQGTEAFQVSLVGRRAQRPEIACVSSPTPRAASVAGAALRVSAQGKICRALLARQQPEPLLCMRWGDHWMFSSTQVTEPSLKRKFQSMEQTTGRQRMSERFGHKSRKWRRKAREAWSPVERGSGDEEVESGFSLKIE